MNKLLLTLLVPILGVLPAAAQSQGTPRTQTHPSLETQVERAVSQATAKRPARHCVLCGRLETEENAHFPCRLDPDVHCYFVDDPEATSATVPQTTAKQPQTLSEPDELSLAELIAAEEELMVIRNQDPHATFEKYPYLLDPAYRRKGKSAEKKAGCTCPTQEQEPLSTQELIEAEEELSLLRSRLDPNATFETYPYLLEPTYRRANDAVKRSIRRPYTQTTWAKKVGI